METEATISKSIRSSDERAQYDAVCKKILSEKKILAWIMKSCVSEFTEGHYENIRKVYSIWICMNPPAGRENSITRYRITEEDLIGSVTEPAENYDLITAVMICLGKASAAGDNDVLKLLDVLLSDETESEEKRKILQSEFDIPMTQTLDREVSLMCNLSKGVWEKGIEEGKKAGIEEGRKDMMLEVLRKLMDTMKLPADEAMAALEIPEEEREKYAKLIK